ncbi:Pyochelin biosynthetic thioesterase (plasmid) [Azospirillum lipoferum 4B]|uniref:Pyochelin biosynthetic thioesterase n=2 Tax=Azospirillum lipoferum TaxID=193 RepID=G7ZCF8_AZOL4|nr:Pyochelin biosynthetic thioesterase [Azospirillum lipoferum 4B]
MKRGNVMNGASSGIGGDWLRVHRRSPAAPLQLACFPHAGGGASFFRRWADILPAEVELVAVQYPGREDRIDDALIPEIGELARTAADALRNGVRRRIALFGHSMGATLAFETARLLERSGIAVSHLFLSGQTPPHRHRATHFHLQSDEDLLDEVRRLAATPMEIFDIAEIRQLLLPVIRSDYRAIETYRADDTGRLLCPITVMLADADTEVSLDEAGGWARHSHGRTTIRTFTGSHFYLVERWRDVVAAILADLGCAHPPSSGWPSTP